ncbi:hypothetical protein H8F24_17830 [Synechococcus sp. CBW1002]|uniref:hypothetical protein n=1 Tax=Synechococcus sp. CBW1002 TaxID=1353134 RepID=UPI0018CE8992|nr:hypothetical protein [Synechococcus sp. CBW1002]QPN59777.1 hypothetical protein H8F24_17830 [Synechococcus sp. CBW1002]
MTPCNYTALREAVGYLSRLGLSLQTVIPVALPAESYPVAKQNSTTGQREVQRDNNGQLLPAFDGKNPSFWLADGEPRLTSQSQPADESEVLKRLDVAERLGQPIELVIIPSTDVVDIDSDRKNYPSKEALDQDWMPLLDFCPELTQTRVERTPGAGSGRGPLTRFSRRNPCPVCGRVKDAKCSTNANGLVLCWRGTTHQPPSWADRKGSHGPGHDGQIWAYLGDSAGWGQFRLDRPLEPRKSIRPKATRAWTYCDRDGTPLITVKRNDDGSGKRKIYQQALVAGKAPRDLQALVMPYGYREALEALEAGAEAVFWVEGEPCVDALRSLGLPAVTSIGGAGKFNPARDGGLFPPDRLVIVPDRDRKGIEHARQIAVAHPGARWLLCWPDQPHLMERLMPCHRWP